MQLTFRTEHKRKVGSAEDRLGTLLIGWFCSTVTLALIVAMWQGPKTGSGKHVVEHEGWIYSPYVARLLLCIFAGLTLLVGLTWFIYWLITGRDLFS